MYFRTLKKGRNNENISKITFFGFKKVLFTFSVLPSISLFKYYINYQLKLFKFKSTFSVKKSSWKLNVIKQTQICVCLMYSNHQLEPGF